MPQLNYNFFTNQVLIVFLILVCLIYLFSKYILPVKIKSIITRKLLSNLPEINLKTYKNSLYLIFDKMLKYKYLRIIIIWFMNPYNMINFIMIVSYISFILYLNIYIIDNDLHAIPGSNGEGDNEGQGEKNSTINDKNNSSNKSTKEKSSENNSNFEKNNQYNTNTRCNVHLLSNFSDFRENFDRGRFICHACGEKEVKPFFRCLSCGKLSH